MSEQKNNWVLALNACAVCVWLFVVYSAYTNPFMKWDAWVYHLPFASFLWNIGGGRSGFIPTHYVQLLYAGFPVMAEWLQGALWTLFSDVRATSLINPLSLGLFCVCAWKWLRIPLFWTIVGALSFPLIFIHEHSAYIDAFVGAMVATTVIAAAKLYALLRGDKGLLSGGNLTPWIVFPVSAIIACNSKVQAWLLLMPLLCWISLKFCLAARERAVKVRLIMYSLLLALLCNYTTIRNAVKTGEPLYPLMMSKNLLAPPLASEVGIYSKRNYFENTTPGYAGHGILAQPVYFLFSVTEIDWAVRHVTASYWLDMENGDEGTKQIRTGGLWSLLVCFHLIVLALLLGVARIFPRMDDAQRFCLLCFGWATFFIMMIPRSHELRYSLVWPMLLVVVNGIGFQYVSRRLQILLACLLFVFFYTGQTYLPMQRNIYTRGSQPDSPAAWRARANPTIVGLLGDNAHCIENSAVKGFLWFRFSRAIIGGTHTIIAPEDVNKPCNEAAPNRWLY